jgi:hypothetical protein
MTIAIVDRLEVIDIEHDQPAGRRFVQRFRALQKCRSIEQLGQLVAFREMSQALV